MLQQVGRSRCRAFTIFAARFGSPAASLHRPADGLGERGDDVYWFREAVRSGFFYPAGFWRAAVFGAMRSISRIVSDRLRSTALGFCLQRIALCRDRRSVDDGRAGAVDWRECRHSGVSAGGDHHGLGLRSSGSWRDLGARNRAGSACREEMDVAAQTFRPRTPEFARTGDRSGGAVCLALETLDFVGQRACSRSEKPARASSLPTVHRTSPDAGGAGFLASVWTHSEAVGRRRNPHQRGAFV